MLRSVFPVEYEGRYPAKYDVMRLEALRRRRMVVRRNLALVLVAMAILLFLVGVAR